MKKALLGVLAAGLLATSAPAATAHHVTVTGGCSYDTFSQATAGGGWYGTIRVLAVAQDAAGGPASLTIGCKIQVNGADAPGTEHFYTGFGIVAGVHQLSFEAAEDADIRLCENAHGEWVCLPPRTLPFPPPEVTDLVVDVLAVLDQSLCPVLASGRGSYGVLTIGTDGDVTVASFGTVLDCPPFQW